MSHPRRPGLDVLRGVAATAVLTSHVAFVTGVVNPARWNSDLRLILPRLDVGVPVFFVLSGLLIARPFVAAVADGSPSPIAGRYLGRRLARIFPLYWVVLAVTLSSTAVLPSVPRLLGYVTLTHIYRPATAIGPITQSWSLATEISFYVFVPVWFALSRRVLDARGVSDRGARLRAMLISLALWFAIALAFRAGVVAATHTYDFHDPTSIDVRGALLTWLPNHLDNFGAGVAMAIIVEWRKGASVTPALRAASYVVAALAVWLAATELGLPALHTGFDGRQTLARHALFLVAATLAVGPSALARPNSSQAESAVRNAALRVATGIGMASYGVYLWHQYVTTRWFRRPGHPTFNTPFPTTMVVVVVVSVALAGIGYWVIERWPQRMLDGLYRAGRAADPRRLGETPALDGLRGLSILAVLGTHVIFIDRNTDWFLRGGYLGVDVFLVLSGFLITATLLRERDRTGTVSLSSFAKRRARRLLPPMIAFFALHAIVVAIIGDSLVEEAKQSASALTFLNNWQLTIGHHPPFDMVHLWSLAVEGQLYLLCGLGVYLARRRIDDTPGVVWVLLAGAGAVALWRLIEFRHGVDLEALYERTDARADSMIIGGLGAILWRARVVSDDVARRAGVAAGIAIVAAWWWFVPNEHALFAGGFTVIAAACVAVILAALVDERSPVAAVANWAPLRAVGRMSYSLYLWHLPIYLWVKRAMPDSPVPVRVVLAVGASFAVAALSYRYVERPFMHRRAAARDQPPQPAIVADADAVIR